MPRKGAKATPSHKLDAGTLDLGFATSIHASDLFRAADSLHLKRSRENSNNAQLAQTQATTQLRRRVIISSACFMKESPPKRPPQ